MLPYVDMLTKRTNILFDEKTWKMLVTLAEEKGTSVGDLVRKAVKEKYINKEDELKRQRAAAFDKIMELRKQIKHTFTTKEIREMIEDGRRY